MGRGRLTLRSNPDIPDTTPRTPEDAERISKIQEGYAKQKEMEAKTRAVKKIQSAGRGYKARKTSGKEQQSDDLNHSLIQAFLENDYSKMHTLIQKGANINTTRIDESGSLLDHAIFMNDFEAVNFLIEHGADVNLDGGSGISPLFLATIGPDPNLQIISLLIKSGAKLSQNSDLNDPWKETEDKNAESLIAKARREIAAENKSKARGIGALMQETRPNTGMAMTLAQMLGIDPKDLEETLTPVAAATT